MILDVVKSHLIECIWIVHCQFLVQRAESRVDVVEAATGCAWLQILGLFAAPEGVHI